MEFPNLGEHCQETTCNTLDFLPFKCDACQKIFCKNHFNYNKHNCNSLSVKNKDFQVPICPLCNQPVPFKRNELPDIMMSAHIDRDCKSDPAEDRRRQIFNNKCFKKGCKKKELLPFVCNRCKNNYCIRHRNEIDHECAGATTNNKASNEINNKRLNFFDNFFQKQPETKQPVREQTKRTQPKQNNQLAQPNSMTDKEALDYALRLSMMEGAATGSSSNTNQNRSHNSSNNQETEEEILARVLAESELEYQRQQNEKKDQPCSIN